MLNGRRRFSCRHFTASSSPSRSAPCRRRRRRPNPPSTRSQTRVDRLYHEAEQASERYNDAKVELDELRKDLELLQADQDRQDDRLTTVREQVQDSIVSQYEGTSLSAVGQAVVSEDPSQFLSQLTTIVGVQRHPVAALRRLRDRAQGPRHPQRRDRRPRAEMAALEKQLASEQATVDEKLAEAKDQLDKLKDEEREELLASRSGDVRIPSNVPASGRAADRRRYAHWPRSATPTSTAPPGPSAFDCSGLTMMAWGQAGVGLPHSSSAQFGSGPARLLQRPAAGRPGLLLQPDQPRRHLHRQRPDRARRQPRRRRPGRGRVLDAVLRCGPPWLIPPAHR